MPQEINPDFETYDTLEDELEAKPTGFVLNLLPESLYELFFGSQPPNPNLVVSHRVETSQTYRHLISAHRTTCENVSISRGIRPEDPPQGEVVIDFDHPSSDVFAVEITGATDESLRKHLDTLNAEIEHVENISTKIGHIIDRDNYVFLRADEQEQLETARQTLKVYLQKLICRRREIHSTQFSREVERSRAKLETLETKMEPYLSYETPDIENDLNESLRQIQDRLTTLERTVGTGVLSESQVTELERIKQRVSEFSDHLENYRHSYLEYQFSQTTDKIRNELKDIQNVLTPAKAQGQPIDNEAELRNQINQVRNKLSNLREYPFGIYTLDSLEENADNIEAYIDAKTTFDTHIESLKKESSLLEQTASPYLNYEEYLTRQDSSKLEELLDTTTSTIKTVRNQVDFDRLSSPDQDRFTEVFQTVSEVEQCIDGYNQEFISRERQRHKERKFSKGVEKVKDDLRELQYALTPAKAQGQPIERETKFREKITQSRKIIADLSTYSFGSSTVDSLLVRTDNIESYIDAKVRFDSRIATVESKVSSLRQAASPYLNYEEYLDKPDRSQLEKKLETTYFVVQEFRDKIDLDQLSAPDQEQFANLVESVSEVNEILSGYNREFITRERDQYEALFSDIGPNNLNLTPEQQQAVIRNGIYNQVIAAAGTGKTLTLTTRVAYLIESQNVDPSDILVITYTREATAEMRERLRDQFGITDITVKTVNAFGYGLIQESHNQYIESIDPNEQRNFIDRQIRKARNNESSSFLNHYYEFLVHFDDVYYDEADFETQKAYIEARLEQTYVTLKGTEVKSRAEKLIADFLFTHQVEYRYEDRAGWADSDVDKAGYTPDFYLPNHEIYIEHWGIDESGSVAPWFSQTSEEYRNKIVWAQQQFTDTKYTLVETYEFQHETSQLKQVLRHRLINHGVNLDQMGFEELVEAAFEYDQRKGWIKSRFKSFIENAKRFELKPADINSQMSKENPRQYHFGKCGVHLLKQYVLYLTRNRLIDFQDMIHDAVESIEENPEPYKERYDHLLVDEFQDIGKGEIELIQNLTGEDAAKLFAVGDDWQSIYSFQGAVIDYFTDFATYFGKPVRTELTTNFRSPPTVVKAGNQLIENNSNQLEKTVRSTLDRQVTPQVHILRGYQFYDYVRRVRRYTVNLVREYIAAGAAPGDIMILCRYDDAVPYLGEIKDGLESQEIPYVGKSESDIYCGPDGLIEEGVSVYSLYQAKGREADHVILVHAAEGPYGFPSDRREDELLDPVKPLNVGGIEEERRAFYVAVTRTKQTLDFLTRGGKQSQFIDEIDEYTEVIDAGHVEPLEEIGGFMTVTVEIKQILDPWTKQHQRAIVRDRFGGSARFVSWTRSEPPTFEQNEWYQLTRLKVSQYKDEKELVWTRDSTAQQLSSAPSITELAQNKNSTNEQSIVDIKRSATDRSELSPTKLDEDGKDTDNAYSKQSPDSANDQQLFAESVFQEVLSALATLEGTASTDQIAKEIGASQIGAYDRLRTLEAEGKVIKIDDEVDMWKIVYP